MPKLQTEPFGNEPLRDALMLIGSMLPAAIMAGALVALFLEQM